MDSDSTENVNVEYFAAILGCYPWATISVRVVKGVPDSRGVYNFFLSLS